MSKELEENRIHISCVGEYGSGLFISQSNGKHYWLIECKDTVFDRVECWDRIPKILYDSIKKHNNERKR